MNINDLPPEILLEIFLYFSAYDWSMTLPEVCNLWNSITSSYIPFWGGNVCVFVDCKDFFKTDIKPVVEYDSKYILINKLGLSKVKCASHFEIQGMLNIQTNLEEILNYIYEECKDITLFVFHNCNGDITENFIDLLNILYPNLKSLKFRLSSSSLNKIPYNKISSFKHLTSLISDDHCFTDSDLFSLAKGETPLTKLAIPCSQGVSDRGLVEFLKKYKLHLEELYISGYGITTESFMMILQCLNLTSLSVYDARQLKDEDFISFSKLLRLQNLLLQRATFSARSLYSFLQISQKNNLKYFLNLKFYSNYSTCLHEDILKRFPSLLLAFS